MSAAYTLTAKSFRIVGMARRKFGALHKEDLDAQQNHRHKDQQYG